MQEHRVEGYIPAAGFRAPRDRDFGGPGTIVLLGIEDGG